MLTSACLISRSTTTLPRNRQRNIHVGVYIVRKVCLREYDPQSTLRRVYDTPRGSHPAFVFAGNSSVVVPKPKNKASVTPFNM